MDAVMSCSGLHVEHKSRQNFIDVLQYVLTRIKPGKIFFSGRELLPGGPVCLLPYACMDIPLSGLKHMVFSTTGELHDIMMTPGEIHYCPPMCWKRPFWDSPHEMSSIVINPDYIRITYIELLEPQIDSFAMSASIFYHTSHPLGKTGKAIVQALNIMAESGNDTGASALMISLLEIVLQELMEDKPVNNRKAHDTWLQICHYLRDNCQSPINRAHVAQLFNLNPSYISRLFSSEGGETFNSMLRRLRLEHAAMLLQTTRLNIDEVADRCGYLSSTFFISTFKQQYGMPPGAYRRHGR